MTRASLGSSSMKPAMQISMQRHQTEPITTGPTLNASPASIRCAPNTIAHTPSANPTRISVKARKPLHFQPL